MIIFIGVAGSGKSVQGRHLSEHLGCPWVSTGELLRMHISGEKRARMLKGELLTDEELYSIIEPVLIELKAENEVILDGFPRTEPQAEWLEEFSIQHKVPISYVIHMMAEKDVVLDRLLKRGRPDDTEESIAKRFTEYEKVTLPIIKYYKDLGIPCLDIDGNGTETEVKNNIIQSINSLKKNETEE